MAGLDTHLGIQLTAVGPDFICGEMPVDERTRQPFGLLHGGASITLAETLGSYASHLLTADEEGTRVAGVEVSGSHLKAVRPWNDWFQASSCVLSNPARSYIAHVTGASSGAVPMAVTVPSKIGAPSEWHS